MRLSKNEVPEQILRPLTAEPLNGSGRRATVLAGRANGGLPASPSPSLQATAELLDVVADRRRDLLPMLWHALRTSKPTGEHAETLLDLVTTCGSADKPSPCRTALAVADDLDQLAETSSEWSHPAQVVESPDARALYRLCAARTAAASNGEQERLEKILPRLERTARLVMKAASRRKGGVPRRPKRSDRWL